MQAKLKWILIIAVVILIADHATKYWIVQNVKFGTGFTVIPDFFDIVHTRNKGAAFGMLHSWDSPYRNAFFYLIGLVAFGFVFYFIRITPKGDKTTLLALSFVTGGALGNLIDRFVRGSVVDFLSWHYYDVYTWPAFNVADMAISVALVLLIWRGLIRPYKESH